MSETENDKLTERVELRVRPHELEAWKAAAELEGLALGPWLRKLANKRAPLPGHACACEQARLELERGNEPRARCDALRAIYTVLAPFSDEARRRIQAAYAELHPIVDVDVDVDDDPCMCEPYERESSSDAARCGNCGGKL